MADLQRKTANLFRGESNLMANLYGTVTATVDVISSIIDVTHYDWVSLSIDLDLLNNKLFRIGLSTQPIVAGSTVVRIVQENGAVDVRNYNYLLVSCSYSATPSSSPKKIMQSMMANAGSTALPYEPYGWVHSLRKLTTATDTFTTLPVDIYADGNNATVGLKGNMQQTGTPTPSSPIQPTECGDLETTGEHTGQYKIPISSASTTTPIYLGEVETTRRIKKLALTGSENLTISGVDANRTVCQLINLGCTNALCLCTHIKGKLSYSSNEYNRIFTYTDFNGVLYISIEKGLVGSSLETFNAYLAAQYANGTPVTVWYVLAQPTTGIVNEPIRKIGDYADTVSGITIPTITGKDTFDVNTTLKPSSVSLSYTGWHDATVEEWDGSQWQ